MLWRSLIRWAGVVMVVGFFLPWVSVSCGAPPVKMMADFSAFNLASAPPAHMEVGDLTSLLSSMGGFGTLLGVGKIDTGALAADIKGAADAARMGTQPAVLLWTALAAAIAIVAIGFNVHERKRAAVSALIVGGLALVPLLAVWVTLIARPSSPAFSVSAGLGFWFTLLAIIAVEAGGFLGLKDDGYVTSLTDQIPEATMRLRRQVADTLVHPPSAAGVGTGVATGPGVSCPKCGRHNAESSAFCAQCGAPLRAAPAQAPGVTQAPGAAEGISPSSGPS